MKPQKNGENYLLPYIARGKFNLKIFISLMVLCIAVGIGMVIYDKLNPGGKSSPEGVIIVMIAIVFIYKYANSCRIIIRENTVFYNYFLVRKRLLIPSITRMELIIGDSDGLRRKRGFFLGLYNDKEFSQDPFKIDITPFRKEDLIAVVNIITKINSSIKMNELAHQLKEGNFEAVLRKVEEVIV